MWVMVFYLTYIKVVSVKKILGLGTLLLSVENVILRPTLTENYTKISIKQL